MHDQFLGWCAADVIGLSRVRLELVLGLVGLASITQTICSQNVWQLLGLVNRCQLCIVNLTRAVQPMATCRQLPYLHKPAIVIVTSFSL